MSTLPYLFTAVGVCLTLFVGFIVAMIGAFSKPAACVFVGTIIMAFALALGMAANSAMLLAVSLVLVLGGGLTYVIFKKTTK